MDVATRVIEKFGGAYRLADLLGCKPSTIYRWTYPQDQGGTGGLIPPRQHETILKLAKANRIKLRQRDLWPRIAA